MSFQLISLYNTFLALLSLAAVASAAGIVVFRFVKGSEAVGEMLEVLYSTLKRFGKTRMLFDAEPERFG